MRKAVSYPPAGSPAVPASSQKRSPELQAFVQQMVERSATPFEKKDAHFVAQEVNAINLATYLLHWGKNVSRDGSRERLERFFAHEELVQQQVSEMLAPVKLLSGATFPEWADVLAAVLVSADDSVVLPQTLENDPVPFEPIYKAFRQVLRQEIVVRTGKAFHRFQEKAQLEIDRFLCRRLNRAMKAVFTESFQAYLNEQLGPEGLANKSAALPEDHYFQQFAQQFNQQGWIQFFNHYPLLARISANILLQHIQAFERFLRRLENDLPQFTDTFGWENSPQEIASLSMGISDPHKGGEGVMIVRFANDLKLVYKPRCMQIGLAYNELCAWINERVSPQLRILTILAGEGYGWIEFAEQEDCQDEAALDRYYQRAGMLLALTYLLDSTDFHAENIIASGEHPVLVDHETLLQPQVGLNPKADQQDKKRSDTVLRPALLPMYVAGSNVPNDSMSGFGSVSEGRIEIAFTETIHINTDKMQTVSWKKTHEITSNMPTLAGEIQRIPRYQDAFEQGFTQLYALFRSERAFLLGSDSPLQAFANIEMRFLFRSTHVYAAILKNMLKPAYLRDANLYGLRIELLARAFLPYEEKPSFWHILESERMAMINRDIPCFQFDSSAPFLRTDEGAVIENYFQASCLDYVKDKLRTLGEEDFELQMELIRKSLQGELNNPDWKQNHMPVKVL